MANRIPVAWLQLTHEKVRMLVAIVGVAFANILMLMQFGFQDALFDSATVVQKHLRGDLMVIHQNSETLFRMSSFPRRRLYETLAVEGVADAKPMYVGIATWKSLQNGRKRAIFVIGIDPLKPALDLPELEYSKPLLLADDTVVFDDNSRAEFGPVAATLRNKEPLYAEIENRRVKVAGLFSLGASFSADGNLITSDLNFMRIFNTRIINGIDVAVVDLKPGADKAKVQQTLRAALPEDVRVLNRDEFVAMEHDYWETSTGIGFIFGQGVFMGFIVGLVIVYQILYTDVNNHLSEYATLKAMGYTNQYLLLVVFQEAMILSVLGYIPGLLFSNALFVVTRAATSLPMEVTLFRGIQVLLFTILMCLCSGAVAARRLRTADPASIY